MKLVKTALAAPVAAISVAISAALGAQAELLVYEGFSSNDYTDIAADGFAAVSGRPNAVVDAVGTAGVTTKWDTLGSAQVMVYGANFGLDYPETMKSAGFAATGGAIGLNKGSNSSDLRASCHALANDVLKRTDGKLCMSMLLRADESALAKLTSVATPASRYYGFGISSTVGGTAYSFLTSRRSALCFALYNKSGTYEMAFVAVDAEGAFHYVDICPVTAGATYVCYAEIGVDEGEGGAETIRAGAVASSDFTGVLTWSDAVAYDVITDTSYPTVMGIAGCYGTNGGTFLADELRIGTTLDDVVPTLKDYVAVRGNPSELGTATPAYGLCKDVVAGNRYAFKVEPAALTNGTKTAVTSCTGWTLTNPEGVVTQGEGTSVSIDYAGGIWDLVWNWTTETRYCGVVREVGDGKAYADIATAIGDAQSGDTVVIDDGTYEIAEPILVDKAICVTSRNGAEKTTILQTVRTEKEFHRCLLVDNPEATVSGLTIKGGYAKKIDYTEIDWSGFGVGVVIGENGGRLLDCIVTGHRMECSYVGGAGVTMLGADSLVRNCVITGNYTMAWVSYAAGLAAKGGVVEDCDISYNTNDGNYGRGNVFFDGPVTMRRCRIVGNQTLKTNYTGWGGWGDPAGIYLYRATGSRIENCLIADNLGVGGGGGVNVECACSFVNCTIVNNSAKYGGGVWSTSSSAKFVNCLIQGNTTTDDTSAGAPEWKGSSYSYCVCPVALPGTDAGNKKGSATFAAGGYELETGSLGIDAGTSAGDYAYLADDVDLNGEGRKWGDEVDVGCYEYRATEMKVSALASADAVLKGTTVTFTGTVVNPAGYDYEVFWSLNGEVVSTEKQFTLTLNEAGAQTMVFTVHGTEFEKKTASVSVEVFPPVVRVVNAALNPGHEPSSPYDTADNAFTNIQEAIDHCIDSMAIAVDEGRYELTTKILLEKEVTIRSLGGCERTILAQTSKDGRVLEINCGKAVVDGFTLTGGKLPIRNCGAGLYIGGLGGTVSNCLITLNFMETDMYNWGAGAYLKNGTLARSRICCNTNNLTYHNGGYNMAGGGGVWLTGSAQLLDCEVVSNAMQCTYASETMFLQPGGGVMMQNGGTMRGCLVADNFCNTWGAGVAVLDGSPKIVGCTIAGNRTTRQGGGIRYGGAGYASSVLKNCAVWGNEAALGGADIDFNGATPQVSYCCSSVGALEDGVDGNVISAESPFRRAHGTSYYPKGASKLVDNGDTAEATETDLLRRSRVVNGVIDIGCYEFPWNGLMLMVK